MIFWGEESLLLNKDVILDCLSLFIRISAHVRERRGQWDLIESVTTCLTLAPLRIISCVCAIFGPGDFFQ